MSSLLELLKSKKAALSAGRRTKTIKPEDGTSRWRILPSWRKADSDNAEQFWHDFGNHYIKDQAGDLKAIYICVDKTFGKPCSICASVNSAMKSNADEEMGKLLKDCKSTGRVLMNAIRTDGETPGEPVILEVPPSVFEGIINIIGEWGTEVIDLTKGKDFVIERSGKNISTKYSVQIASKGKPLDPSVMKQVANLDEYVAQESEEQAIRALTNFRQVAGLMPSSTMALSAPSKPAIASMMIEDDIVEGEVVEAKPVAKSVAKPAAKPVAAEAATGDAELDALLADLG